MKWHVRSPRKRDTHQGALCGDGEVVCVCGIQFPFPGKQVELPGEPPTLLQICPVCYHDPYGQLVTPDPEQPPT